MSEVIAERYAEALFQLANEKQRTEELLESSQVVRDVFRDNPKLGAFLSHPSVSGDKKNQFLGTVFGGIERDILHTVKLLVERHRTDIIPAVMHAFVQKVNDAKGIAEAQVYTARKLTDDTLGKLESVFAKRFGKESLHLENVVDPSVIGGVKVRIGNTIYDGSLSGKLNRMKREIVSFNN